MDRHESPNPSPFGPDTQASTSATINETATAAAFSDAHKARAFAEEVADVCGVPREHPGTDRLAAALASIDASCQSISARVDRMAETEKKNADVLKAAVADARAKYVAARLNYTDEQIAALEEQYHKNLHRCNDHEPPMDVEDEGGVA